MDYSSLITRLPDAEAVLGISVQNIRAMNPLHAAALVVCHSNAMRIGETLALTIGDRVGPGMYAVQAAKGGRTYTVMVPLAQAEESALMLKGKATKLFPCSYQQVYKAARKAGLRILIDGRNNAAVTHTGRYKVAQVLEEKGRSKDVTDILRHKNAATRLFYLRRPKKNPEDL